MQTVPPTGSPKREARWLEWFIEYLWKHNKYKNLYITVLT